MTGYAVRTAAGPDLPAVLAVLAVLAQGAATPPDRLPDPPVESQRQREMWERMLRTGDLTTYLASSGDQVVGTAGLLILPNVTYHCRPSAFIEPWSHQLYRSLGFESEAEGFRRYLGDR